MIIRKLRQDENWKLDAIQSLAFGFTCDIEKAKEGDLEEEVYGAYTEDGETLMATIFTPEYQSHFCGRAYPSVGIGGVATLPEYRRMGAIRAIFHEIFRLAPKRGWVTSFLYPFSFDYYRQFGYERVLMRREIKCPASTLKAFPRNTDARLYIKGGSVPKGDLLTVYNRYAEGYNIMFRRAEDTDKWSDTPHGSGNFTYVWYDDKNQPAALATIRCKDDEMRVAELCYLSPAALRGILGFLRMFEGQVSEYRFCLVPEGGELELLLSEYVNLEYKTESCAMGRILQPEVLLRSNTYPTEPGRFRLRVDDPLPYARGVYDVTYGNGMTEVTKLPFESEFDLSLPPPALARVLLGTDNFTAEKAAYLDGVIVHNPANHFFRAFPKRNLFLYEGF